VTGEAPHPGWAHRYSARIRPQECSEGGTLGHPRFLEHFEAAFIDAWRERFGPLAESLGADRRLTVAAVEVQYRAPVGFDDLLLVDLAFDRAGRSSVLIRYEATVDGRAVAQAGVTYVCLDSAAGAPVELPELAQLEVADQRVFRPRDKCDLPRAV
jgi:YbgC/YbaW family acyl-CoA thioester hydrolase